MTGVCRRRVVLERFVVGNVVGFGGERQGTRLARSAHGRSDVVGGTTYCRPIRISGGGFEPALEVPPGDALGVKEIADVLVGFADLQLVSIGAVVAQWLRVADHRA